MFIQESKLGIETPDTLISNYFYNLLRRDRIAGGGGLLVYTKKAYKLFDVVVDPTFETIMFSIIFDKKKNSKQILTQIIQNCNIFETSSLVKFMFLVILHEYINTSD